MSEIKTIKKTTRTITEYEYEFTTDDLEALVSRALAKHIGHSQVEFDWHIGQWVSLTVKVTAEHTIQEE